MSVRRRGGDDNFVQLKTSATGPLGDNVAERLSFSGALGDPRTYGLTVQLSF
jgi:hypothetical protein